MASAFRHAPLRGCRSAGWPSGSRLSLFGMRRFGVAAGRVRSSAFLFGNCRSAVGLRAHCFRFSACAASEIALGGLVLPPSVSAFAARRVGLWAHGFRFSACAASEIALGELVLLPSASELPLGGLTFGLPLRGCRSAGWRFRLPLRGCHSAGWPSGSRLPLFGTRRFGVAARRVGSSAFRFGVCHSAGWCFRLPLRSCPRRVGLRAHCFRFSARPASEITARRVGLRAHGFRFSACTASGLPSASWPSGSRLLLFGMRRSAPPYRRSEGRRNTPTRHLFHFKTLIPTC